MAAAALWLGIVFAAAELGQRLWPLHDGGLWLPALCLLAVSRLRGFGCLAPGLDVTAWREPAAWPQQAARLAMLPMMAALPAMADWCSASGVSPPLLLALHAAVMLLPPLLLPSRPALIAALLLAGGLALLWLPGLQGLTAAMLLHGAAWSLARGLPAGAGASSPAAVGLSAAVLLAIGFTLAEAGPAALRVVHGALALCGAAALLVTAARRHNAPHARLHRRRHP